MIWTSEERYAWATASGTDLRRVFPGECESPLGSIAYSTYIRNGPGVPAGKMRLLGRYGLVIMLDGKASYRDATGTRRKLAAGDALFLLPELAHTYGPISKGHWTEFHVVFSGPLFDGCKQAHLFDPSRLVYRLTEVDGWLDRFEAVLSARPDNDPAASSVMVSDLLGLITRVLATRPEITERRRDPEWLQMARRKIEDRLSATLSVAALAREMDMNYDSFRKAFHTAVGMSPTQYHGEKRIEAACALLEHTQMTNKQIADSLGFCDEFHFSSRFRVKIGVPPGAYRRREQVHI